MKRALIALALLLSAPRAFACGDAEALAFLAAAQTLAPDFAGKGAALLPCAVERDEAVQWLAFARSATGDAAGSLKVDAAPVRTTASGDRGRALARAKNGDYQELLRRVDAREPNYATAADAQLALARALVRRRDFERGRSAYVDLLRLDPTNARAEAEYLFAFLWEGRAAEADEKCAAVRGVSVSPYLRDAAARCRALAQKLAQKLAPVPAAAGSADRSSVPLQLAARGLGDTDAVIAGTPGVGFYLGDYELRDAYRRTSATGVYEGVVTGRLAAHDLHAKSPGANAARASEVRVGGARQLAETFGVRAQAGYFSQGTANLFGQAHIVAGPPRQFEVYAGAARTPLALELPLAAQDLGLMRDALQLGGHFQRYAEASFEVRKDGKYSPHERHRLLGRLPLLAGDGDEHLDLRLPLGLERHPRPSPLYNADPRTITAGAGAEYGATYAAGWSIVVAADYILSSITLRDPAASTRRSGALAVDARVAAHLSAATLLSISGTYYRADSEADLSSLDRLNALTAGLVWQTDKR